MAQDILTALKNDHHAVETLLDRFDDTDTDARGEYLCEVVQTLVGHEVAEELVVYPVITEESEKGEEVSQERLDEQAEAEQTLSELEDLDPRSGAFTNKFKKLREAVLAHARAEEATAFPLLEKATTAEQRRDLTGRYQKAKDSAPTHPHPHAPDKPPGNRVVGPVAAVFDRARDAVQRV
jgi:hemerythrin superfamily protein